MFTVQQAWIALSDSERSSWNTYAATFPRPTKKNIGANLNGFNYFSAYHLTRQLHSTFIVVNPNGAQETLSFDGTVMIEDGGALTWDSSVTLSGGSWIAILMMSGPISPTTQASKNRLRKVHSRDETGSFTTVITDNYTDIYGAVPVVGDTVLTQEIWVQKDNGQFFTSVLLRSIVDAI